MTVLDRQIALREIVQTPKALPGFDLAAFQALGRAEQARRWAGWSREERLRVAHAAMAATHHYSDEAGAELYLERLSERLGGAQ